MGADGDNRDRILSVGSLVLVPPVRPLTIACRPQRVSGNERRGDDRVPVPGT